MHNYLLMTSEKYEGIRNLNLYLHRYGNISYLVKIKRLHFEQQQQCHQGENRN